MLPTSVRSRDLTPYDEASGQDLSQDTTQAINQDDTSQSSQFQSRSQSNLALRRAVANECLNPPRMINLQAAKDIFFDSTPSDLRQTYSAPLRLPPFQLPPQSNDVPLSSATNPNSNAFPVIDRLFCNSVSLPILPSQPTDKRFFLNARKINEIPPNLPCLDADTQDVDPIKSPALTWKEFMIAYSQGRWDPMQIPRKPEITHFSHSNIEHAISSTQESNINRLMETPLANCGPNDDEENIFSSNIEQLGFLPAPKPPDEKQRLMALYRLNILKESRSENFARIAHLAKLTFGVEKAVISLLDENKEVYKNDSLHCLYTSRKVSICAHAILQRQGEPLVIRDAMIDWRFAKNPLVTGDTSIRFYAGAPLQTSDGHNLGTFSIIDSKPRDDLSPKQRHMLKEFAAIIVREMDLHSESFRLKRLNRMQDSVKKYAQICLEREERSDLDMSMHQLYDIACKLIKDTLGIDGVCILDLLNMELMSLGDGEDIDANLTMSNNVAVYAGGVSALAEEAKQPILATDESDCSSLSNNASIAQERSSSPFATGAPIQVLGEAIPTYEPDVPASSMYSALKQPPGKRRLGVHPDPVLTPAFVAGFLRSHPLGFIYQNMFPPSARHFFPAATKSIMLFPIYNVEKEAFALLTAYSFDEMYQFEDADLMYLGSIGLLILGEVMKHRVIIADRAKGTFIGNISHELRTPLHGILASLELLMETPLNYTQLGLLNTIESCGKSLIEVINHVLDFSKLGANARRSVSGLGAMSQPTGAAVERVNLVRVVEEVVESCYVGQCARATKLDVGSLYDSRGSSGDSSNESGNSIAARDEYLDGVEVILDVEKRAAGWIVKCEKGGVRRVLMNLIGNSLKFTTHGYVHVSIAAAKSSKFSRIRSSSMSSDCDATFMDGDKKTMSIVLTVSDTGKGISPQFLQSHLFHPFTQEDPLHTGTGLGMSIVKMIVESMGGKIEVRSEVGIGTEIRVFLEVEECEMDEEERHAAELLEVGKWWSKDAEVEPEHHRMLMAPIEDEQHVLRPLSIALEGIDNSSPPEKRLLRETIRGYIQYWLSLEVTDGATLGSDLIIVDEDVQFVEAQVDLSTPLSSAIVVMMKGRKHRALDELAKRIRERGRSIEILHKPFGPIKLANTITRLFEATLNSQTSAAKQEFYDEDQEEGLSQEKVNNIVMDDFMTPTANNGSPWSHVPTDSKDTMTIPETQESSSKGNEPTNSTLITHLALAPTSQGSTIMEGSPNDGYHNQQLEDQVQSEHPILPLSPHGAFTRRHSEEEFIIGARIEGAMKRPVMPPRASTDRKYVPTLRSLQPVQDQAIKASSGTNNVTSSYHKSLHDQLLNSLNKKFNKPMQRLSLENLRAYSGNPTRIVKIGSTSSMSDGGITSPPNSNNNFNTDMTSSFSQLHLASPGSTSTSSLGVPSTLVNDPLSPILYPLEPLMRSPRVLIVEDNHVNRMILSTFLRKRGIEHEEAENGEVGVYKFETSKNGFDIILMDIQMPTMDGNEATAAIREIEKQRMQKAIVEGRPPPLRARVFALTGLASEQDKKMAFNAGVDSFLTKPVSLKMLGAIFEKWGV